MKNEKYIRSLIIVAIVGVLGSAGFIAWQQLFPETNQPNGQTLSAGITRFTSAEDFTAYLEKTAGLKSTSGLFATGRSAIDLENAGGPTLGLDAATPSPDRVSQTNVQVAGIDEPDIVKTDGSTIFVSSEQQFFYNFEDIVPLKGETVPSSPSDTVTEPNVGSGTTGVAPSPAIIRPEPIQTTTKIVKATPPESLGSLSTIDTSGNLLLDQNTLVVLGHQTITGYVVADPSTPTKNWTATLPDNSSLVTARLRQGKIYIVTQTYIQQNNPCPLAALSVDGRSISMPCTEIYHPVAEAPVDSTYTAMVIDPQSGVVEQKISFVGGYGSTIVYMSNQALYITYSVYADPVVTEYDFLTTAVNDLIPASVQEKIRRLQTYDLSRQAKLVELQTIITNWQNTLSADQQEKLQKTLSERQQQYQKERLRTFETTNIVKVLLSDLSVAASGAVPGHILNQFAIDEDQNNVRLATTSSGGFFGGGESVNDVYVLGSDLKTRGTMLNLAPGERIYSARFVGQTGYVVTFKQVDPFFVLDLSDPTKPTVAGQLKIPGFSSYLHPLTTALVLGVGQEGSQTKLSLFDVSNPSQPIEKSKLLLDRGWTEVQSNHHAFLQDAQHQVVFLPAGDTGEIVSYNQDTLTSTKTVNDILAQRALYINDYLYVIGQDKIVVLNEQDWTVTKELVL